MSLSKQQTYGAIGGGVFALGVCVLGWFLYSSWSEMGELEENLQMQDEAFRKHNAAPIFPSKKAIEAVKSNEVSFVEWGEKARVVAAGGDKAFPGESPSQFKQRLQNEVQRLAALPGGAAGKIAGAEFKFGFEQFLKDGGALPKSTEVERLAVQLDTISTVVDLFAESGVLEVKSIVRVEPKQDDEDDDQDRRKKAKKGKKSAVEEDAGNHTSSDYVFEVLTRPAGFVSLLNALTANKRFFVVSNLSFVQSADTIVEKIVALENARAQKGKAGASRMGRRSRLGGAAAATPAASESNELSKEDRIVVNPEMDAPFQVTFTLTVHDFGSAKVGAASEAKQPEATVKPQAQAEKKEGK